ncbi:unnamed protein product, partial [Urochloa humidicola]
LQHPKTLALPHPHSYGTSLYSLSPTGARDGGGGATQQGAAIDPCPAMSQLASSRSWARGEEQGILLRSLRGTAAAARRKPDGFDAAARADPSWIS